MLDRRNFMKTCSGLGLAGTLFPGVLWAQAQAQGAKKITKEMIENAAAIGRADFRRIQRNDARKLERSGQGLRRNLQTAHTEFSRTGSALQSGYLLDEVRNGKVADENVGGFEEL